MSTLEQTAELYSGNWKKFDSFCWSTNIEDKENFGIYYTHHRDSELLALSNARTIDKILKPYIDNINLFEEHHTHWAVGWIDGYAIRVYENGKITKVFRTLYKILEQLEDYPILDEEDYLSSEYEATLNNIVDCAWRIKDDYILPEDWCVEVYSYLSEHNPDSIENVDDNGGYPSEEDIVEVFDKLYHKN